MEFQGLLNAEDRQALIDYLHNLQLKGESKTR